MLVGKQNFDNVYNDKVDPSTTVEFQSGAARFPHYYVNTSISFLKEDGTETAIPLGRTLGQLGLLVNSFDDIVRGCIRQPINIGNYTPELSNQFVPNSDGIGLDVLSFDIQRGNLMSRFVTSFIIIV